MTTTNREVFYRDPTAIEIPNLGVAKVKNPEDDNEWKTLEWELRSFVCEGEYAKGLDRILSSFHTHIGQAQQPAVWVSGFYGSGKSHLVRVLEYLWRDTALPSGESARGLAKLPTEISDHLVELSMAGKREGGLWSAAGTLGAGALSSVRLAFLSVVFEAAGLPHQYGPARFVLWLKSEGTYDQVEASIAAAGKSLDHELSNLYVSPVLAGALLEVQPDLADSVAGVHKLLQAQFPSPSDIQHQDMVEVFRQVLESRSDASGKQPLTLIVLDEMQEYLKEHETEVDNVRAIAESCAAEFGSRVLFVATGQAALTANPTLQKLIDRFSVHVTLSDTDVEAVVRKVILQKQPDKVGELQDVLEASSGEIDRQLGGTRIAPVGEDKAHLVADYPLLPTRRRFWERALRAIDKAGKAGVLRTQLKIVHEAAREVAGEPLGHVVGADFIYQQQSAGMLNTGVLLKEIDELIRSLDDGSEDGSLKSRLCALIFLIGQLPREGLGDIGLTATAPFLADLLVEDLTEDGVRLRKRVPELLEELQAAGSVMRVDQEYRLQTEEGAEWTKHFNTARAAIADDAGQMAQLRNEALVGAIDDALGGLKLQQGQSRTPRKTSVHWGPDEPATGGADVPVWIRDEWSVGESTVRSEAAGAGDESPVVHVFLPKLDAEGLKDALAGRAAAQATLHQKPVPQTDEGRAAQRAMQTRLEDETRTLSALLADIVAEGRVLQGGGNVIERPDATLRARVEDAAQKALTRLFPKFDDGDHAEWAKVVTKAREGAPDSLTAIGYTGEVTAHKVCKQVLAATSGAGTAGADLRKQFTEAPYGWPEDALRGSLYALLAAGNLLVELDGRMLAGPKELQPSQVGKATFFRDVDPPTTKERLAVRGLLGVADVAYEPNQEGASIPALLQRMLDLAERGGGPAPLPDRPDTTLVADLQGFAGNEQVRAVAEHSADLRALLESWKASAGQRTVREQRWAELDRLLRHASGLDEADDARTQRDAIEKDRLLLIDPDPTDGPITALKAALGAALADRIAALNRAVEDARAELAGDELWQQLDQQTAKAILDRVGLVPVSSTTPTDVAALLAALDETPLRAWDERIELVAGRIGNAREQAAKHLEPESVRVSAKSATITTPEQADAYVEALRAEIGGHLDAGHTVII